MKYRPNPRKNSLNMTLFSSWVCWLYGVQLQCKLFQSNNASKLVWQLPWSHQNSRWILQWPWKKSEKWYQENIGKLRSRLRNPPGTWMIGMMARRKIMRRFALLLWFVSNGSRHIICFNVIYCDFCDTIHNSPPRPGVPCLVTITHHKPGSVVTNLVLTYRGYCSAMGSPMQCKCGVLKSWWLDKSNIFIMPRLPSYDLWVMFAALSKLPYLEDGRERVGGRVGTDRQTRVSSKARPSLATLQQPTTTNLSLSISMP